MNTTQPANAEAAPIELMSISGAFAHAGFTEAHGDWVGLARQVTVVAKTIIATAATFFMFASPSSNYNFKIKVLSQLFQFRVTSSTTFRWIRPKRQALRW
jgi:hypothetical protein